MHATFVLFAWCLINVDSLVHGWILDFPSDFFLFFLFEQPIGSLIFQRLSNDYVIWVNLIVEEIQWSKC